MVIKISLGITTAEFDEVFADQKVTISSSIATITIDPIYGQSSEITYVDSAVQVLSLSILTPLVTLSDSYADLIGITKDTDFSARTK